MDIYKDLGSKDVYRILNIFERLNKGEFLTKEQMHNEYGVSEKTIQRDIADLRYYLMSVHFKQKKALQYKHSIGYVLTDKVWQYQTNQQILSIAKILLESRAFKKEEMDCLLNNLIFSASPSDRDVINNIICNERFHYIPPQHNKPIINLLWEIVQHIYKQNIIKFSYKRQQDIKNVVRTVKPVAVMFSEYYFYLIAYLIMSDKPYPAFFRLDRISNITSTGEKTHIEYSKRFQDGELRKKIQFMYGGKEIKVKFKFWGTSLEAVYDKLPTAQIIGYDGQIPIIEASIFGKGIIMWFFSQMDKLELLEPLTLREEMKRIITGMNNIYK